MPTDNNVYLPTPAQVKLIEVLVNPEHFKKNITEKCRIAGVDRSVYYDAIKKPEFKKFLKEATIDILGSEVADVITAVKKYAISDPKCHADRKMWLELTGLYKNEQNIKVTKDDLEELSEEEIALQLAELKDQ